MHKMSKKVKKIDFFQMIFFDIIFIFFGHFVHQLQPQS